MVDRLCDAARTELMRTPRRSRSLAQLAVASPRDFRIRIHESCASSLRRMHGDSLNAYRIASRYESSLAALDEADRRIADVLVLGYDRAVLALARGFTSNEMGRLSETLAMLEGAREIFASIRMRDKSHNAISSSE